MVIIRITANEEDICLRDIPAETKLGAEISNLRREESRTKQMIHLAVFSLRGFDYKEVALLMY